MKTSFLKIFILITLLAAAGAYFYQQHEDGNAAVSQKGPGEAMQKGPGGPVPVSAVVVKTQDIPVIIHAVGSLLSSESAEIRSEIAGIVKAVNFSEGRPVKKGDSLVEIDDSLIRAELMKAEATYNVRKNTFGRSDRLKTSGYVSSQDWEQNKGSLQEAAADVETARIRLEKTKVLAPFDGQVGLRNFSAGDFVQVGQTLTTLDAVDPVKITFSVPEKNYADLKEEQPVSFSVDSWPGEAFSGRIYAIDPRVDQNTRSFDVKAIIPNADGRLRPGMFAQVKITTAVHKDALVVPEEAILPRGVENFVFIVRDGKAVQQKVTTGLRQPGLIEITEGLAAGDLVISAGLMKLQNGAAVSVVAP